MKISIVTAVYNRSGTVGQAIQSVSAQDYGNVEHVLVDGGSTDGTLEILHAHASDGSVLISEPDEGIYDALNKGISRASGDVIGLMHSDDFFAHDRVLSDVAQCFENPEIDAVYGDLDYISASDTNRVIRSWTSGDYTRAKLKWGWMPPHPTLFLRISVFQDLGYYDTSYRIAADYDAILRYFGTGNIRPAYIPEVLIKMRVGGESNRSLSKVIRKSREDYRALRANRVGGLGSLASKNLRKVKQFF